jgi:CRISPR/Cas system type I-B associated protein Csh2 (Cas7 group RAMP superfamily)
MKKTIEMKLSEISEMIYDLQNENILNEIEKLELKIRKKFNIDSKLIDIECYSSQVLFDFKNVDIIIECNKI